MNTSLTLTNTTNPYWSPTTPEIYYNNASKGASAGALIGVEFGPVGVLVGAGIGGILGLLLDD